MASFSSWLNYIKSAEKTSIIKDNLRKIHYTFPDGKEMVEDYSMDTGICLRRLWKKKRELRGDENFIVELGEELANFSDNQFVVRVSNTEPALTKRITKNSIEYRIRNLPYSIDTYVVQANLDTKCVTVKTVNKKYFKNILIEELDRCGLIPNQENIKISHQYNTLIIQYKKPQTVLDMEAAVMLELKHVETISDLNFDCSNLLNEIIGK